MDLSRTHVVTVISNPVRYKSRYELYRKFEAHMKLSGATLWTCELAFGDRPFEITQKHNPQHLQLRTTTEIWHKENMINLMVQRLPDNWQKVLWIDADIEFVRKDWLEESWHQLEHYDVIQLFSDAIDLGPENQVIQVHKGFVWSYIQGQVFGPAYRHWHPGFAWGMRREMWDQLGSLMDWCILGAADHHMALAMIHQVRQSFPPHLKAAYLRELIEWEDRCKTHLRKNIGYVSGTIFHWWHGKKRDRRYIERWDILVKNGYDPDKHLKPDWQGVLQLCHSAPLRLRDQIRQYFRQRNEDSIDLE